MLSIQKFDFEVTENSGHCPFLGSVAKNLNI